MTDYEHELQAVQVRFVQQIARKERGATVQIIQGKPSVLTNFYEPKINAKIHLTCYNFIQIE